MNKVYILLGPTSTGKTSFGVELCKKLNGEIISFDSRQVCKYMDIGTGKLPINSLVTVEKNDYVWNIDGVNIWGYDLTAPNDFFSGYDFCMFALKKARELVSAGKSVFLVGGTGFYLDLFTGAVTPSNIKPNFELRDELEKMSLADLQKLLMSLNLDVYNRVDRSNKVRLVRAIEIAREEKISFTPLPYLENVEFVYFGLTADNKFLYDHADLWLDTVWKNGLLDEIENLKKLGFEKSPKLGGLVYKTANRFLCGELNESMAIQRCKFDLHAYIRRQLTYFNKNKNIKWFDISTRDFKDNISSIINV